MELALRSLVLKTRVLGLEMTEKISVTETTTRTASILATVIDKKLLKSKLVL